jgi:enamine deaminase RidA (YjgF/YER057c/UK114 family)
VHLVNGISFTSYQLPLGATADSLEGPPITNQLVLAYPITGNQTTVHYTCM